MSWFVLSDPPPERGGVRRIVGLDPASRWHLGPGLRDFVARTASASEEELQQRLALEGFELVPFIVKLEAPRCWRFNAALKILGRFNADISGARENDTSIKEFIFPPGPFLPQSPLSTQDRPAFVDQLRRFLSGKIAVGGARKAFFDVLATPDRLEQLIRVDLIPGYGSVLKRCKVKWAFNVIRNFPKRLQISPPIRAAAAPAAFGGSGVRPPVTIVKDEGFQPEIVIGLIDQGIDPDAAYFDGGDGYSRLKSFWRQDFNYNQSDAGAVPFGAEERRFPLEEATIDRLPGVLIGGRGDRWLPDPTLFRVSHGAHIASALVGDLSEPPDISLSAAEDEPAVVAVELSRDVVRDTSGASLDAAVLTGVFHIIERAQLLAGGLMPFTVINISYGYTAGQRGPSRMVTQALNELICEYGDRLRIVLPVGNARQARVFAAFEADETVKTLPLRVQPDDKTPSFIEIWTTERYDAAKDLWVSVATPGRDYSAPVSPGGAAQVLGNDVAIVSGHICPASKRGYVRLAMQPTARAADMERGPLAPPGLWRIEVSSVTKRLVEAWITRDDTIAYYRREGRQSYFDDPDYVRFDREGRVLEEDPPGGAALVKRGGLLNAIASDMTDNVAGEFGAEDRLAVYSGAPEPCVYWSAISDDSQVHSGVMGASGRDGTRIALNGTSVASARVARHIVEAHRAGTSTKPPKTRVGPPTNGRRAG